MKITRDQQITLTLSKSLLARLDASVPTRRRSKFIVEAIEEKLAIEEQLAALEETAGAWTDYNHPDLRTAEDIDNWLRSLRAS